MAGAAGGGEALTQTLVTHCPGATGPVTWRPGLPPASSTAQPLDTWPPALLSGPMLLEKASEDHIGFRTETDEPSALTFTPRATCRLQFC